jgi:hypothetical protein
MEYSEDVVSAQLLVDAPAELEGMANNLNRITFCSGSQK